MNTSAENYFIEGCGRCSLGATPECKVHRWSAELRLLRHHLSASGLTEVCKWGGPCYTYKGQNVVMLTAFKSFCALSFFKGILLTDKSELLQSPGPNSQATRLMKFTNTTTLISSEDQIKAYIQEAILIEQQGRQVTFKKEVEPLPQELIERLEQDPMLRTAFEALTPGRQRGYILYFSAAKQAKTRSERIDKYTAQILNGEGLHDKYRRNKS